MNLRLLADSNHSKFNGLYNNLLASLNTIKNDLSVNRVVDSECRFHEYCQSLFEDTKVIENFAAYLKKCTEIKQESITNRYIYLHKAFNTLLALRLPKNTCLTRLECILGKKYISIQDIDSNFIQENVIDRVQGFHNEIISNRMQAASRKLDLEKKLFESLPVEILFQIFSSLNTKRSMNVASTNKYLNSKINSFWQPVFERHFPHRLSRILKNNASWPAQFHQAYKTEYARLKIAAKRLFLLVKEDNQYLTTVLKTTDLNFVDINDRSLLDWAIIHNNQALLNHIYQLVKDEWQAGKILKLERMSNPKTIMMEWAILCYQPQAELDRLYRLYREDGAANISDFPCITLLLLAVQKGNNAAVKYLLKIEFKKKDISYIKHRIKQLLKYAVENGQIKMAGYLMNELKLDSIDVTDCLLLAAKKGHLDLLEFLLTEANEANRVGISHHFFENHHNLFCVLWDAVQDGHVNMVEYLIKNKATFRINSLFVAIEKGYLDVFKLLLEATKDTEIDINTPYEGKTLLFAAVQNGRFRITELLLQDVRVNKNLPITCSTYDLRKLDSSFLKLISSDFIANKRLMGGITKNKSYFSIEEISISPKEMASIRGYPKIVRLFNEVPHNKSALPSTIDVNITSEITLEATTIYTSFHTAVEAGDFDKVKGLLVKHSDIIHTQNKGEMALFIAALKGDSDIVDLLLQNIRIDSDFTFDRHLLDTFIKDKNDKTSIDKLIKKIKLDPSFKRIDKAIAFLLYEKRAAFYFAEKGNLKMVKYILENYSDTNAKHAYPYSKSLLYIAAENGRLNVVNYLLEDHPYILVEWENPSDKTSFHIAAENGHLDVLKCLLEKYPRINVNNLDNDGKTPFHIAAENGHYDVVEYLLQRDININNLDKNGKTPLYLAAENGHLKIVELLLNQVGRQNNPIDSTRPFISSVKELEKLAKEKNVRNSMATFIKNKKTEPYLDQNNKYITPKEIASIMGHRQIGRLFDAATIQHKQATHTASVALKNQFKNAYDAQLEKDTSEFNLFRSSGFKKALSGQTLTDIFIHAFCEGGNRSRKVIEELGWLEHDGFKKMPKTQQEAIREAMKGVRNKQNKKNSFKPRMIDKYGNRWIPFA